MVNLVWLHRVAGVHRDMHQVVTAPIRLLASPAHHVCVVKDVHPRPRLGNVQGAVVIDPRHFVLQDGAKATNKSHDA
jgi:UDP-N-acetylglucosamine 2-epimerase